MTDSIQDSPLKLIFERNRFYRRQYLLALSAFIISLIVIMVLTGVAVFLKRNPTHPLYFATDSVGRLIEVVPVDKPNMELDDVIDWVIEAVENTYSYDYVNYRGQLQDSQKYFTEYGWTKYMSALQASNNLVALKQRRLVEIAKVVDRPKLVAPGFLSGALAWKFEMPLLITYMVPPYDDKSKFSNPLNITVLVQRRSILQSDRGLGIVQIIGSMMVNSAPVQPQEMTGTPSG